MLTVVTSELMGVTSAECVAVEYNCGAGLVVVFKWGCVVVVVLCLGCFVGKVVLLLRLNGVEMVALLWLNGAV